MMLLLLLLLCITYVLTTMAIWRNLLRNGGIFIFEFICRASSRVYGALWCFKHGPTILHLWAGPVYMYTFIYINKYDIKLMIYLNYICFVALTHLNNTFLL